MNAVQKNAGVKNIVSKRSDSSMESIVSKDDIQVILSSLNPRYAQLRIGGRGGLSRGEFARLINQ